MEEDEKISGYCPICSGCGEEGCCSPLMCEQSPEGHYCQSYLNDLKFGYRMNKFFEEHIVDMISDELKAEYDAEWDRVYDKIYSK